MPPFGVGGGVGAPTGPGPEAGFRFEDRLPEAEEGLHGGVDDPRYAALEQRLCEAERADPEELSRSRIVDRATVPCRPATGTPWLPVTV